METDSGREETVTLFAMATDSPGCLCWVTSKSVVKKESEPSCFAFNHSTSTTGSSLLSNIF